MCGRGLRCPSDGGIGNEVGLRCVIVGKLLVRYVAVFVVVEHIDVVFFRYSGVSSPSEVEESDQSNSNNADQSTCNTAYEGKISTRRKHPRIHIGVEIIRTSDSTDVTSGSERQRKKILLTNKPTYEWLPLLPPLGEPLMLVG